MNIIHVPGTSRVLPPTKLRYKFYDGDKCVFNQVPQDESVTSSINLAEDIILAICAQEGIDGSGVRFFDLQTSPPYRDKCKQDGEGYEFEELIPADSGIEIKEWRLVRCPPRVEQDFAQGRSMRQVLRRKPDITF